MIGTRRRNRLGPAGPPRSERRTIAAAGRPAGPAAGPGPSASLRAHSSRPRIARHVLPETSARPPRHDRPATPRAARSRRDPPFRPHARAAKPRSINVSGSSAGAPPPSSDGGHVMQRVARDHTPVQGGQTGRHRSRSQLSKSGAHHGGRPWLIAHDAQAPPEVPHVRSKTAGAGRGRGSAVTLPCRAPRPSASAASS